MRRRFVDLAATNQGALWHSGFWNRMLSGTTSLATEREALVRMPREVARRFSGGTITPKGGKKWLTLPMRSEAYGKSERQFNDLRFQPTARPEVALLVQREQTQFKRFGKRSKKAGQINPKSVTHVQGELAFFLLVKSVTQRGDAGVFPSDEDFAAAGVRGW